MHSRCLLVWVVAALVGGMSFPADASYDITIPVRFTFGRNSSSIPASEIRKMISLLEGHASRVKMSCPVRKLRGAYLTARSLDARDDLQNERFNPLSLMLIQLGLPASIIRRHAVTEGTFIGNDGASEVSLAADEVLLELNCQHWQQ